MRVRCVYNRYAQFARDVMPITNWAICSQFRDTDQSGFTLESLDSGLLKSKAHVLRLESTSGARALFVPSVDLMLLPASSRFATSMQPNVGVIFVSEQASRNELEALREFIANSDQLASTRYVGLGSSEPTSPTRLKEAGWQLQSTAPKTLDLGNAGFRIYEVSMQSQTRGFTPAEERVGEGSDNLRQRSSWFKRHSGS
jgi:hypothetical protein